MDVSRKYPARLVRVIDGDTVELDVDAGFRMLYTDSFRLAGINAPEMKTAEGPAAKAWLLTKLSELSAFGSGKFPLQIESHKQEKYGRWIVTIYDGTNPSVNQQMVTAGQAVSYMA
jgi:micrococcal nuclease